MYSSVRRAPIVVGTVALWFMLFELRAFMSAVNFWGQA